MTDVIEILRSLRLLIAALAGTGPYCLTSYSVLPIRTSHVIFLHFILFMVSSFEFYSDQTAFSPPSIHLFCNCQIGCVR